MFRVESISPMGQCWKDHSGPSCQNSWTVKPSRVWNFFLFLFVFVFFFVIEFKLSSICDQRQKRQSDKTKKQPTTDLVANLKSVSSIVCIDWHNGNADFYSEQRRRERRRRRRHQHVHRRFQAQRTGTWLIYFSYFIFSSSFLLLLLPTFVLFRSKRRTKRTNERKKERTNDGRTNETKNYF